MQTLLKPFEIFEHKSIQEIGKITALNSDLISKKTSISTLSNSMFNYLQINVKELKKQNIVVKTVRLQENLKPKESMSFEQVNFHEVVNEQWDSSFLKNKFTNTTFLFIVFQSYNDTFYFRGLYSWKMPVHVIENDLKHFWQLLHTKLKNGITLTKVVKGSKTVTTNDLPTSSESKIMHIRPKAQNANDVTPLPDGQLITKQAYWINASYIGQILASMPTLQVTKSTYNKAQLYYNDSFSELLTDEIYTIDEFIKIAKQIDPNFDEFKVNEQALNSIGYKLSPPYTISAVFENATEYFHQKILKDRYFELPTDSIWQTNFVSRTLEKLENEYSLFKIDTTTYITEKALANAKIEKQKIKDYKTAVEDYVSKNRFFTLTSLRNDGFRHLIDDFGFVNLFYESILRRPGHLQHLKICGHYVFIKSPTKPSYDQFLSTFFDKDKSNRIELDDLLETLIQVFNIKLNYTELEQFLKSTPFNLFYSPELTTLFKNKGIYLDYIY